MTHIIWNGCDGYDTVENLCCAGRKLDKMPDGRFALYKGWTSYLSFAATEINPGSDELEFDEDGELKLKPGQYVTTDFRFWKEIE